jgi:hypothetical protein
MQIVFKEYLNLFSIFIGFYSFYSSSIQFFKYFKKFLKKMKFFRNFLNFQKNCESKENPSSKLSKSKTFISDNYAMMQGRAIKIFSRLSEEIDTSIIISKSNTTYYEDFLLLTNWKKEKFFIQPDNKTKFFYLPKQYLRQDLPNRFLNFFYKIIFRKSEVIRDKDYIYLFGKIEKNPQVFESFKDMICVRPKDISGNSFDFMMKRVKSEHVNKILHLAFVFAISGFVIFIQLKNYFHRIKKFVSRLKRRRRVTCKECGENLCNVMCEKCSNMTEFCDRCYLNLQAKIDSGEINLEDVKCCFCKGVLDYCQKFTYHN